MSSVLITGGTGFFGQGFVRRLLADGQADRICVFSRNEWAQAQMRSDLQDDDRLRWFIGDVRDRDRLKRAMQGVDLVIHAAALKRIEVAEYNVMEAVSTNVFGSENVVAACSDAGVKKAVLISSDKAVEPVNIYGMTKAIAERLFLAPENVSNPRGPRFAVVRYGNVAGSTGSVIPRWRAMLNGHRVVPVTNPDATRFWMSRDQAVDLVFNTARTMSGGEVAIPDLPAFRVGDLAEAMDLEIKVVGMAPQEKMHESLLPGVTSELARRMSVAEIREALKHV